MGMTLFAIGSDTTGSVRLPAAATGCCGVLMTPGVLPMEGGLPNTYSMDRPGPITWTAEDAAIVLDAMLGTRLRVEGATGVRGLKVAVVRDPGPRLPAAHAELSAAFEAGLSVLSRLGARITEAKLGCRPALGLSLPSALPARAHHCRAWWRNNRSHRHAPATGLRDTGPRAHALRQQRSFFRLSFP